MRLLFAAFLVLLLSCGVATAFADTAANVQQVVASQTLSVAPGSYSSIVQQGSDNTALTNQPGYAAGRYASQTQIGDGNYSSIAQTAPNDVAITSQIGNDFHITITQTNPGQQVTVSQHQ